MEQYTLEEVTSWLTNKIAENTNIASADINLDKGILEYGLDSLKAVGLVGAIEDWIGEEIPVTTLWDYPTIRSLANFIHQETLKST